ncbi:plasmid mobilization relaxosome protein MobC [Shigella boydii]
MAIERKNIIAVRFTDEEFEPFKKFIDESGVSKSDFFRAIILSKEIVLPQVKKLSKEEEKDYKKLLFFVNKASNNINQIAKRLNMESKGGAIKETTYIKAMNALISIRDSLLSAIK